MRAALVADILEQCASRRSASRLYAHDLVRKPDATFRDHAGSKNLRGRGGEQNSGADDAAREQSSASSLRKPRRHAQFFVFSPPVASTANPTAPATAPTITPTGMKVKKTSMPE